MFKEGQKVKFKNDKSGEVYMVYAVYTDTMVSLGLLEYPDVEQDILTNIKDLEIVK